MEVIIYTSSKRLNNKALQILDNRREHVQPPPQEVMSMENIT